MPKRSISAAELRADCDDPFAALGRSEAFVNRLIDGALANDEEFRRRAGLHALRAISAAEAVQPVIASTRALIAGGLNEFIAGCEHICDHILARDGDDPEVRAIVAGYRRDIERLAAEMQRLTAGAEDA